MPRILAIVVGVIIVVLGAGYGWLWVTAQRTIPLSVSPLDRAAAIASADRILKLGSAPDKWPVRLFIPANALQDIAGTVAGTTYSLPFGDIGPRGPDGYLVATIRKLEFYPAEFLLRARVEMDVTYVPANRTQRWGDATVQFSGTAKVLPVHVGQGDSQTLGLRLIPTGFAPAIRWGPLNVGATEMLSQVVASHLVERMGRDFVIPIPALSVPIEMPSGIVSTHEGSFPAGGHYRLSARIDGGSFQGEISTDQLLIVSSGVWLLGGLQEAVPSPSLRQTTGAGLSNLDQRALATKARLAPFERTSGNAEAHISIAPILSLIEPERGAEVEGAAPKDGYTIRAAITEATGVMIKTNLVSNKIVGDVSFAVSPASQDFAVGTLTFTPLGLQWRNGLGLTGELDAAIDARAKFRTYLLGSRLSQAMAANIDVKGTTAATIPFTLGAKLMSGSEGSAIMLIPDAQCTRVAVDLRPDEGADSLFSTRWYSLQSAGVRVERNIGGGAAASIGLIDSKPRYVPFPVEEARGITFPFDGIAITTAPKSLVMGEDGIDVIISLHARPASKAEQGKFATQRAALHAALRKQVTAKPCSADQQFKLLL